MAAETDITINKEKIPNAVWYAFGIMSMEE